MPMSAGSRHTPYGTDMRGQDPRQPASFRQTGSLIKKFDLTFQMFMRLQLLPVQYHGPYYCMARW